MRAMSGEIHDLRCTAGGQLSNLLERERAEPDEITGRTGIRTDERSGRADRREVFTDGRLNAKARLVQYSS